jgi:hypothetical protein
MKPNHLGNRKVFGVVADPKISTLPFHPPILPTAEKKSKPEFSRLTEPLL